MKPFRKRNLFNLSHEKKLTCNMGKLVPVMCEEVLPGDIFKASTDLVVRLAPMLAPIMHNVSVYMHYFFVPNRLIWSDWENFITGGPDGNDASVAPYINFTNVQTSSLADYFGIPTGVANPLKVSALPFRAYDLIYNEWYRDENLIDPITISLASGEDTTTNTTLLSRAWQHDYFTNALPFQQRGDAVALPMSGNAPIRSSGSTWNQGYSRLNVGSLNLYDNSIVGDGSAPTFSSNGVGGRNLEGPYTVGSTSGVSFLTASGVRVTGSGSNAQISGYEAHPLYWDNPHLKISNSQIRNFKDGNMTIFINNDESSGPSNNPFIVEGAVNTSNLYADLSNVTAANINDLRYAFQVQRWLEKNARGGARYVESMMAHFGVRSSDARLQRPEYLGGGRSPIVISEVLQHSSDDDQPTPLATMAGHGISAQRSRQFKRFFEEHGYVIGILSIMPQTTYQQGLPKMWSRETRYDYYWPVFSHLGEQAVLEKELYAQGNDTDNTVFGYQPRYQEYRRRYGSVHGDFRTTLNYWHLGRTFNSAPTLSKQFIECDPSKRVFAVQDDTDCCLIELANNIKALRPIPKKGTPGFIDHD